MNDHGLTPKEQSLYLYAGIAMVILGGILMFIIDPQLKQLGQFGVLDLEFSDNHSEFTRVMAGWGAEGRSHFLRWLWLDYLYPMAYAMFFYLGLKKYLPALLNNKTVIQWLAGIPLLAGFLDWVENSMEILLVLNMENITKTQLFIHSAAVYSKWTLAVAMILLWAVAGSFYRKKSKKAISRRS